MTTDQTQGPFVLSTVQRDFCVEAVRFAMVHSKAEWLPSLLEHLRALPAVQADAWKEAAYDLATVGWMPKPWPEEPRHFLAQLIVNENNIALDPQVSEPARSLIERGKAEAVQAVQVPEMQEVGWITEDGFPALIGHKPLAPKTKLYAEAPKP